MSSVEKRHMSHRVGGMLHHRFPNGFTDLFMDETDREVSTLTDRAFRSLCVGDDAVYNDELLYGYSPFSCHKPLVGQPLKKNHHKESKKQRQDKTDKNYAQPWKQQEQKNMSHMSSFLKALSATEESSKGMLITNGGITDSNEESWDKSALRSIQRELSEFSSDYHSNVTGGYYEKHHGHQSGDGSFNDAAIVSGKSLKSKHGKSTIKLTKLIITNFFLHSEFSPFQTWGDVKQFTFDREDSSILSTDSIPKWYDLPFYKELTEPHRKENVHEVEVQSCQKATVEPPPTAPKPIPPPPPPKVLPKPADTTAERCSSERGDGSAAPWRRNRTRAKSVIPVNLPGISVEENSSKTVDESLWLVRKEPRFVEVTAVGEVSSLASTPFSICQLMTPIIPSRQPTETSEILLTVLSPSCLDLPLRPHSEAKLTPEPAVKRDSYKSLASSILFNLKDNRKRVKSRYSPPKFKTVEVLDSGTHTPQSDNLKYSQACSEGYASGLSTPAIFTDRQTVCVPGLELINTPTDGHTKHDSDRPLSDDYLLSNLLQTNKAAGSLVEESPISPLRHSKKNKSPRARMQNYPSLNLYKKASPIDSAMQHLPVPQGTGAPKRIDQPTEANKSLPRTLNKDLSQKALPINTGVSPNSLNVKKDWLPLIPPIENEGFDLNVFDVSLEKRAQNKAENSKRSVKVFTEKDVRLKGKDASCQPMSTMYVIKAAREAINAAKNKAITTNQSNSTKKPILDPEEVREREVCKSSTPENNNILSPTFMSRKEAELDGKKGHFKKVPPPVPKRNFAKSDILLSHNKEQTKNGDKLTNGGSKNGKFNLPTIEDEFDQKQGKLKHNFSARQNNYIKYQRYAGSDEQGEEFEEGDPKVNPIMDMAKETRPHREMKDSEHIINDLNALKELQRARLGDRVLENADNKLSVIDIDEEARAKNNLISRELRNIKKGMLSIRGNTTSKRELFAQKEKDPSKQETFAKIDSNVVVNKALMNDNYDRAKMALEEIISERERRKNKCTEQDPIFDERCVTRAEQSKNTMKDYLTQAKEKANSSFIAPKDNDFKERLGDLRDHNHMRQILSQSEPGLCETHRSGGRLTPPEIEKMCDPSYVSEEMTIGYAESQISDESGEKLRNTIEDQKANAPLVPPRSKRGGSIRNGSVITETDTLRDVVEEDIFNNDGKHEKAEVGLTEIWDTVAQQYVNSDCAIREACQSETSYFKERWDVVNNAISKSTMTTDPDKCEFVLHSKDPQSENKLCISPEIRGHENKANHLHADMSPTKATGSITWAQETPKVKQKAPLKPDYLNKLPVNNLLGEEEPDKFNSSSEKIHADEEEISRHITSPLLLVNGISVTQSPPDQASLSSKSSYFSVESALHRNIETESNVYHSLENLIGDVEEVDEETHNISQNTKQVSDGVAMEYYSLSDHESEPGVVKHLIKSQQKQTEVTHMDTKDNTRADQTLAHDEENQAPMSHSNIFSPSLGIPALFKVKDITVHNNLKLKTIQPWSPRGSVSEWEEEVHQAVDNGELPQATEPATEGRPAIPDEIFSPKESPSNISSPLLQSPSPLKSENPKEPQAGGFLAVPWGKDRSLSTASEGVESLTASTADEMGTHTGVSKVPSERSESTCSGNGSHTGPPKPPVVLPKSEKAVLKAVKLANRRIKKEEAQKSSQKSPHTGSKHRVERPKSDKPEHRNSSSKNNKSSDINHREKSEVGHRHSESNHGKNTDDLREKIPSERKSHNNESHISESHHHDQTDRCHRPRQQGHGSFQSSNQNNEALPSVGTERQGRSSRRDKREHRHYSSDRLISKVPVYKAQLSDRPSSDRPFQRSQSIDRYLGDKVSRRLSDDTSVNENLDPRTQRIEKSIMDELQQRGRARDKTSRNNAIRRSHSIDAYPNPSPSTLSHQSSQISQTSQLSRQSSFEHGIVAQSFPLTQRKLLQDPDSGQYFFVDMPLQVKTKTFFDPETGSYVQLPVQPPDGIVPQVSPLEVLTQPLVVYHSFVPVPLSPMAQKGAIQVSHMEPRLRQMHGEGHPYLEHVYGQQDHMLGEFLGTEELDCPS
ncbi:uncharacterized protein AB9W97_002308 isoform 1-T4 [Spinachia spinachia]